MKSLLEFFGLCKHGYKIIRTIGVYQSWRGTDELIGHIHHQQCKKCGKLKRKEIEN